MYNQGRPSLPEAMPDFCMVYISTWFANHSCCKTLSWYVCFRFSPLFSRNFQTLWKIFEILPFPEISLDFHPPKFLMTFSFSHRTQILNFPPCFAKIIISPLLSKISPLFSKNSPAFYILYVYFVSPYFDHDVFMHHPMHVLDAPAYT